MSKQTLKYLFTILTCLCFGCEESSVSGTQGEPPDGGGGGDVVVQTCDPKDDMCLTKNEVVHCVNGKRISEYCPENEFCFDGKCGGIVCEANKIESCLPNGKYHGCNHLGTGMGDFDCSYGTTCVEGECKPRLCLEGAGRCLDEDTIVLCNEAGTAYEVEKKCSDIAEKTICEDGACISICDKTTKEASYIGCEYWAVDLDNAIDAGVYDAAGQPFAVVLSNTHETLTANVSIYTKIEGKVTETLKMSIPPKALKGAFLPNACYDNNYKCLRAYAVNGTCISDTAFYIKSDLPITAAQFNPLHNVDVFSNDASLLFPTTALGRRYKILGRPQWYDDMHAFVTIVATEPGQTEVAFEAACTMMSGIDKKGGTIYPMKRGEVQTFYLDQYDILNLETRYIGDDPTGSIVTANKNVAVFAGNEATSIPETDPVTCCADHIEHQQYPLGAWGKKYNASKLKPRGKERDMWRILARVDDTRVTFTTRCTDVEGCKTDSPVLNQGYIDLNDGEYIDILTTESFNIEANSPVLVGQFMSGQNDPLDPETMTQTPDWAGIGDPAYLIGVPVEQYRKSYQFLAPDNYEEDYITIVAPVRATVELDGKLVDETKFKAFGNKKFKLAYMRIEDGAHSIEASDPIGLFSYGVDNYVSYGYPAGLDLKNLFD
ncbi:MAG: IgGFc-binding protein [Proteobacteria bacterium]|nr:IgGFc-binding protein [Pseudomonadota bacterium]